MTRPKLSEKELAARKAKHLASMTPSQADNIKLRMQIDDMRAEINRHAVAMIDRDDLAQVVREYVAAHRGNNEPNQWTERFRAVLRGMVVKAKERRK